jgi:hypothetical protein
MEPNPDTSDSARQIIQQNIDSVGINNYGWDILHNVKLNDSDSLSGGAMNILKLAYQSMNTSNIDNIRDLWNFIGGTIRDIGTFGSLMVGANCALNQKFSNELLGNTVKSNARMEGLRLELLNKASIYDFQAVKTNVDMMGVELNEKQKEIENDRVIVERLKQKIENELKEMHMSVAHCCRQLKFFEKNVMKITSLQNDLSLEKNNTALSHQQLHSEVDELATKICFNAENFDKLAEVIKLSVQNNQKIDQVERRLTSIEDQSLEKRFDKMNLDERTPFDVFF